MNKAYLLIVSIGITFMAACSPLGLVDNTDTATYVSDPTVIKNQKGVLSLYSGTIVKLSDVMAGGEHSDQGADYGVIRSFARLVGHISDELDYGTTAGNTTYPFLDISTRNFDPDLPPESDLFTQLSGLRILALETQAGFRIYGEHLSDTILAHAMAIEASALIMTAELYCSGVPLSRLEYNGDIVLTRGYSTEELYFLALEKLDSASIHSHGNARISGLIDVLRIRVLLGMGKIEDAAVVARNIETSFQYSLFFPKIRKGSDWHGKFTIADVPYNNIEYGERMGDLKGSNGLPYASSGDPRVHLPTLRDPWAPFVMASGIEARLAEAEAAIRREDASWLTILNELRTSCLTMVDCPTPAPAGSGGVPGLGLLDDPGTEAARLDILFKERAYWLFLRGFRQGDLRRRIRVYGGSAQELYPVGLPVVGNIAYGYMVSMPVPLNEQRYNSHYKGCQHNDA